MTAGYSRTPTARKLGITEGTMVGTFGAPDDCVSLLAPLPAGVEVHAEPTHPCPVILVFAVTVEQLRERLAAALEVLPAAGGLWVAWPKRASGVSTELDFSQVQETGLGAGLVDNKVAAIDDVWSGLRFVVRLEDRDEWLR